MLGSSVSVNEGPQSPLLPKYGEGRLDHQLTELLDWKSDLQDIKLSEPIVNTWPSFA